MHVVCQTLKTFTPAHPHTHTHSHYNTHAHAHANRGNAIYMPSTGCARLRQLSSAALFALAASLPVSVFVYIAIFVSIFAQSRIRSAALYAMHFSALLTLERALGQSGRDPSCTSSLCPCFCPCTPLPSTCYCCLQRLHCNAAASSARARFLAACMCDCVCASVVCLKGYVLHSSLYVCVFVCVCQHSAAGILIRKTNSARFTHTKRS